MCRSRKSRNEEKKASPINQTITQPSELLQKIPEAAKVETRITNCANSTTPAHSINNTNEGMTQRRPLTTDVPFYPGPTYRPSPKPIRSPTPGSHDSSQSSNHSGSTGISPEINIDFKKNSPFQDGATSEVYQRPTKSFFQEPQELQSLMNTGNLVQTFLPKQANIDKILNVIRRKVLKGMK